jgi:hypothetical protein
LKISNLKHQLEIMELNHKHEMELLKLKQNMEKEQLINQCHHKYDDGSSAFTWEGLQWNGYECCAICGKSK